MWPVFSLQNQFCNEIKFAADFSLEVIHKVCNSPSRHPSDLVVRVEIRTVSGSVLFPKEIRNILSHLGVTVFLGQRSPALTVTSCWIPTAPTAHGGFETRPAGDDRHRQKSGSLHEVH